MKNISVFIEGGKKKILKFKTPFATYGSLLAAKEVTVFWNFKKLQKLWVMENSPSRRARMQL